MKRIIIASVIAMTVVAAGAAGSAGTAWGANTPPTAAVITFDSPGPNQVTLTIPTPPCDATMPNCVWKFFLNEPKLSVDVATVYGSSGSLTLDYPANFCGIIQADAYVGPTPNGPWQSKRGWQHPINTSGDNCEPSTTTTTTTTTDEPGTTVPPPPSEPSSTPPAAGPVTVPPSEPQAAAVTPVVAAAAVTPSTATTEPAAAAAAATSLPFTGANLEPFVILGVLFVALGLGLLVRRRKPTA